MDRDIEREYDKLVFNYKKLKEENSDLNKRLDELNRVITTNEERRRNEIMHYRRYNKNEKAKFIRIINELNLKLCEMKNSIRHDALCKVETQERNDKDKRHDNENNVNVFASYQSCIIERIQKFVSDQMAKIIERPAVVEHVCGDHLLQIESIKNDREQNGNDDTEKLLNTIKVLCNSMNACDPTRNILEQTANTINIFKNTQELLLSQLDDKQVSIIAQNIDIENKNNELNRLTQACNVMVEKRNKAEIRIDEITKDLYDNNRTDYVKKIKIKLNDANCRLTKRIAECEILNSTICEKDRVIKENDEIISNLKTKLYNLELDYNNCKVSNTTNDKNLKEMHANILKQENIITKLENDNCYKTNYIKNIENKNDDLKKITLGLECSIIREKKAFDNLKENLKTSNNKHNEEVNNLCLDIERLNNKMKENKMEHSVTIKELESIKEEKNCLNIENESLNKSIRYLKNKLENSKRENEELKDMAKCYTENIQELNRRNEKLNDDLRNQKIEYDDETMNVEILNKQLETSLHKINSTIQEKYDLNCVYEELNRNYKELQNNYDNQLNLYTNSMKILFAKNEELQLTIKELSHAKNIIRGNELLIDSYKCDLEKKNEEWRNVESELQDCKIKLDEEVSMTKKNKNKYLKLKHEQMKSSQDKCKCINNGCARNLYSVIPSCHESTKCQTEIIAEIQSRLDNRSLEVNRLIDRNRMLCEDKKDLQSALKKAICSLEAHSCSKEKRIKAGADTNCTDNVNCPQQLCSTSEENCNNVEENIIAPPKK